MKILTKYMLAPFYIENVMKFRWRLKQGLFFLHPFPSTTPSIGAFVEEQSAFYDRQLPKKALSQ